MRHPGRPLNIHVDRCLCGSGKLIRDCCLCCRRNTTPAGQKTGFGHPLCFARSLCDCSRNISREHYISRGILDLFPSSGIAVSGMPWILEGKTKRVSRQSLTGKILCERHNHALSPLDSTAVEFFRFFVADWTEELLEVFLVRGYDLERWLLKVLCGLVASGNATLDGKPIPNWCPSSEWLEILFGSIDVAEPNGLHSIVGKYHVAQASVHATPVFKMESGMPIALALAVEGVGFLFAMEPLPPKRQPTATDADTRYRPMVLQLRKKEQTREAHLGWPHGDVVSFDVADLQHIRV